MQIRRIEVDGPDGSCGISFADWGDPRAGRTIVCVHGLTRTGRDFDHLARMLARNARVICPDVAGRGLSDPLRDPEHYALPTYVGHMLQLLAGLGLAAEREPEATLYIRVPRSLKDRLEAKAKEDELSLNAWVMRCVEQCARAGAHG